MAVRGVSILLTYYNGVKTIGAVLNALNGQTGLSGIPAEVILIDNNPDEPFSADIPASWTRSDVPFRIVQEPKTGNFFAKKRGVSEAKFDYLIFLEDDNIPAYQWIANAVRYLDEHPSCGMVGGENKALFMIVPPPWFYQYLKYLAVGKQGNGMSDDISLKHGYLWGAGLVARKEIPSRYFQWMGHDLPHSRQHPFLTSVDAGFCRTARLLGYELHYSEQLKLHHVISPYRMSWINMQVIYQQLGAESIWIDLYTHFFEQDKDGWVTGYLFKLYFGSIFRSLYHFYHYLFRSKGKVDNRHFLLIRYYRSRCRELRWWKFGSFIRLLRRMKDLRKSISGPRTVKEERIAS
jgi:glycosyltransferase involved in cell wall biosynthesis